MVASNDEDESINGLDYATQHIFYRQYLLPLLRRKPDSALYPVLLQQSYLAFRLGVKAFDVKRAIFANAIYDLVKSELPDFFAEVASLMMENMHDVHTRRFAAEKILYSAESKDKIIRFAAMKDLYRTLFENEFRLWSTIPYTYVCRSCKIGTKVERAEDSLAISASTKYVALNDKTVPCPYGDIKNLLVGFDNDIRNAGGGHEDWEIDDEGMLVLKVHNPKSGALKKTITLSEDQMQGLIDDCRKTIWVLQTGLLIHLVNSGGIPKNDKTKRVYKKAEIESLLKSFSADRWFHLEKLSFTHNGKRVDVVLRHIPPMLGLRGSILLGNGQAYDIVQVRFRTKLEEQIWGILQYFLIHLPESEIPSINLTILDRNGESFANVEYSSTEMQRLNTSCHEHVKHAPTPAAGFIPPKDYYMILKLSVPAGLRQLAEDSLEQKGEEVVKDFDSDLGFIDRN